MADIIDFATGTGTDLGTITFAGGAAPMIGSNILIGNVTGLGTPLHNSITDVITGGALNFITGSFVSYADGLYTFGPGGSITIEGLGPNGSGVGQPLLVGANVSGTFDNKSGALDLAVIDGTDYKDLRLLAYYGLPATVHLHFNGQIGATVVTGGTGGDFTATSRHTTDIANETVPDGGSTLMLLGLGTAGLALVRRRFV
jgi:hypothetical protein